MKRSVETRQRFGAGVVISLSLVMLFAHSQPTMAQQWSTDPINSNNIYYNAGAVGIGIQSSKAQLHINGAGETVYWGSGTTSYPSTPALASGNWTGRAFTSDYRIALQDGNGRVNHYWNTYFDSTAVAHKYIVSNEAVARFGISVNGTTGANFSFYGAPGGTAGNNVSWTQYGVINDTNIWWSPRGTSSDFSVNSSGNVGIGTASPYTRLTTIGVSGEPTLTHHIAAIASFLGVSAGNELVVGASSNSPYAVWLQNRNFYVDGGAYPISLNPLGGNVGIGTTTPGYMLDVAGTINASGVNLNGSPITSSQWATSGANISYTAANGNVGIGTAPASGNKLDVNGNTNVTGNLNASGTINAVAGLNVNGTPITSSQWATSGANISYTAANGNVGIGTTSPAQKLEVAGNIRTSGGTPLEFASLGTGTYNRTIVYHDTSNGLYFDLARLADSIGATPLDFNIGARGGTAFLTIKGSSSNVGIGTSSPQYKLDVNGNTNVTGDLNTSGTITGGNIVAKYQDVAEWVESSQSLCAGTVVVLDQTKSNQVIASSRAYDTRVAGVISAQPGITLGEQGDSKVLVATTGRVRVRVDATNGPIQVGDLLVTSDIAGVAKKSEPLMLGGVPIHRPGTLIGKALEPLANGTGEILVLLSLQ